MDWLIGHLVGDYLLQNDWMAGNKKVKTLGGELACNVHCLVWTLSVLLFTGWWEWKAAILVYLSHYILDRTGLVKWWVDLYNNTEKSPTWIYILTDNTLHLVFLYLIDKFII
jgi:hypothetical protein